MAKAFDGLQKAVATKGKPSAIVSRTVKGYPINGLIGDNNHHGKPLTKEQAEKALAYLDTV